MDLVALKLGLSGELVVLEKLGEGGEGEVFLCRSLATEEQDARGESPSLVALKLLKKDRPPTGASLELVHPNIVRVIRTGTVLGRAYLVMDYFPGKPLRTRLSGRPLPLGELRIVFDKVARALEHAHASGVVHQDVKPENVLVQETHDGLDVRLTDFGLAAEIDERERAALLASRSLRSVPEDELRTLAGTLPYLAPERLEPGASRRAPDPRTDVYALGVLLFEALTGRAPAGLELPSELRPELDARWDQVLKRALATDPSRRFSSVAQFRNEVESISRSTARRTPSHPASSPRIAVPVRAEPSLMVEVPPGRFIMGHRERKEASPRREVSLGGFSIDKVPVTNAAYLAFVLATGAKPPRSWPERSTTRRLPSALGELPVTGVTWDEANAFALWSGKRLPTEAEWERAARGLSGRDFPYGEVFDLQKINADAKAIAPSTARPEGASDEGVLDLTGNVWQWCADWYGPYDIDDSLDPRGPSRGDARVIRGGYDATLPGSASAWYRAYLRPDVRNARVGFRCARDL